MSPSPHYEYLDEYCSICLVHGHVTFLLCLAFCCSPALNRSQIFAKVGKTLDYLAFLFAEAFFKVEFST